jgi:hypothetical protein
MQIASWNCHDNQLPPYDKNKHWISRWCPHHLTHSSLSCDHYLVCPCLRSFAHSLPSTWLWEEEEARPSQPGAGCPLSKGDSQRRMEGWGWYLVTWTQCTQFLNVPVISGALCFRFQFDFHQYFYIITLNLSFVFCTDFFSIVGSLFVLSCYLFLHLFIPSFTSLIILITIG